MKAISKNIYFDALDDIVKKTILHVIAFLKMKPIDVKSDSYAEYNVDSNAKDSKFKIGDHVRILQHKNIFAKGYAPNWPEEGFVIKKVKNAVPWTYLINDLNGEEIIGGFYEKELQKTNQEEFRIGKVIKRKRSKLYVKCKGYDNSLNSWTDKKCIV